MRNEKSPIIGGDICKSFIRQQTWIWLLIRIRPIYYLSLDPNEYAFFSLMSRTQEDRTNQMKWYSLVFVAIIFKCYTCANVQIYHRSSHSIDPFNYGNGKSNWHALLCFLSFQFWFLFHLNFLFWLHSLINRYTIYS